MLKDTQQWFVERRGRRTGISKAGDAYDEEDWRDLWESLPESAKEQSKRIVEDDQLRRRAQELNLWPYLWSVSSEEAKERLRCRWKVAKIQPKVST